jgi:GntR family transcriptional regulator
MVREQRPGHQPPFDSVRPLVPEQPGADVAVSSSVDEGQAPLDVHIEVVAAPAHIARMLDLEDGESVCARTRRFPDQFATSYLPLALVEGTAIMRAETGVGGSYARLAELGHAPAHFREHVRCRPPTEQEAEGLGMTAGQPVIKLWRTALDSGRRAVEVTEMTLDSTAYGLDYEFDR